MATKAEIQAAKHSIVEMLDGLSILATIIGTRSESHEAGPSSMEETALMDALFKVSEVWTLNKP